MSTRLFVLFMACAALETIPMRAAIILSDTFSYPNGVLQTVSTNKWTGHSGTTNQVDVAGGALNLTGSESQDVHALLAGQPYTGTGGDALFVSFDLKMTALPSNTGAYFAHFKDVGAGFRGRIWALTNGAAAGSVRLGIGSASGSAPTATAIHPLDLKLDTEHRVVARLVVSNSVVALWIDPASETSPGILTDSGAGIAISAFAFRQASGLGKMVIDNVVVGTAFADVVPPSQQPSPASSDPPVPPSPSVLNPAITMQPESRAVLFGQDVVFTAEARGADPLAFQWRFNDRDIPGATNAVLSLNNITLSQQGDYRLVVNNATGIATSVAASLTVIGPQPPKINTPPTALTVRTGQTAAFTVAAQGTEPLGYRWCFNGAEVSGANASTLMLTNVTLDHAGNYQVRITNMAGSVESPIASLTVELPPPPVPTHRVANPPAIRMTNYLANLIRPGDLRTNTFSDHALGPGEKIVVQLSVTDPDGQAVRLFINSNALPASATWTVVQENEASFVASLTFSPTPAEAGSNYVPTLLASNTHATNEARWCMYVPTPSEQQIVVSEFLANPAGLDAAPPFNPLGRKEPAPNPSTQDEFVEIANLGGVEVDLSRWTISDSSRVRHRFADSFLLQPSSLMVVYGGPLKGAEPVLPVPAIPANAVASGLGLDDADGDLILLRNADGHLVSRVAYSSLPSAGSLTRHPTLDSDFVSHATITTNLVSPGTHLDGRLRDHAEAPPAAPILLRALLPNADAASVVLLWNAESGRSYSVWHSGTVDGPFSPLVRGVKIAGEEGRYVDNDPSHSTAKFYRVSTP